VIEIDDRRSIRSVETTSARAVVVRSVSCQAVNISKSLAAASHLKRSAEKR